MTVALPARGTILRGRYSASSHLHGDYRVTAVVGLRVYVTHVAGAKYCMAVHGWSNMWIAVEDLGRFTVVECE